MEALTIEDALDLFSFPRSLGLLEDKEMTVAIGRFGPYVRHNNQFFSLPKTDDPMDVTADRAIEIIELKRNKDLQSTIREFEKEPELKVLNGRYGPYISYKKKNYKIPKGTDPVKLSLEDCMKLVNDPANTPKKRFVRKKK